VRQIPLLEPLGEVIAIKPMLRIPEPIKSIHLNWIPFDERGWNFEKRFHWVFSIQRSHSGIDAGPLAVVTFFSTG
jgi:hypothetical protein